MAILRRTVQRAAPAPQPAALQVKRMRRVWRKGKPKGDYWYVDTLTREGAINFIARQFKESASNFETEAQ